MKRNTYYFCFIYILILNLTISILAAEKKSSITSVSTSGTSETNGTSGSSANCSTNSASTKKLAEEISNISKKTSATATAATTAIEMDLAQFISKLADSKSGDFQHHELADLNLFFQEKKTDDVRLSRNIHILDNLTNNQFSHFLCIREAISNAIDSYYQQKNTNLPVINVRPDETTKGLVIEDNGVGMSLDDIATHLLVPNSSSKREQNKLSNMEEKKPIGQFGQGFFSLLSMLGPNSGKVVVETKKEKSPAYQLIFTMNKQRMIKVVIKTTEKSSIGTKITINSEKLPESKTQQRLIRDYFHNNTNALIYIGNDKQPINDQKRIQTETFNLSTTSLSSNSKNARDQGSLQLSQEILSEGKGTVNININGVLIKQIEIEGINIHQEITLNFPANTPLTVDRGQIDFKNAINQDFIERILNIMARNRMWPALNSLAILLNDNYFGQDRALSSGNFYNELIHNYEKKFLFVPAVKELTAINKWSDDQDKRVVVPLNPIYMESLAHIPSREDYRQLTLQIHEVEKLSNSIYNLPQVYSHHGVNHLLVEHKHLALNYPDLLHNLLLLNEWGELGPPTEKFNLNISNSKNTKHTATVTTTTSTSTSTASSNNISLSTNTSTSRVSLSAEDTKELLSDLERIPEEMPAVQNNQKKLSEQFKDQLDIKFFRWDNSGERGTFDDKMFVKIAKFSLPINNRHDCIPLYTEKIIDLFHATICPPNPTIGHLSTVVGPNDFHSFLNVKSSEVLQELTKINSCMNKLRAYQFSEEELCSLFLRNETTIFHNSTNECFIDEILEMIETLSDPMLRPLLFSYYPWTFKRWRIKELIAKLNPENIKIFGELSWDFANSDLLKLVLSLDRDKFNSLLEVIRLGDPNLLDPSFLSSGLFDHLQFYINEFDKNKKDHEVIKKNAPQILWAFNVIYAFKRLLKPEFKNVFLNNANKSITRLLRQLEKGINISDLKRVGYYYTLFEKCKVADSTPSSLLDCLHKNNLVTENNFIFVYSLLFNTNDPITFYNREIDKKGIEQEIKKNQIPFVELDPKLIASASTNSASHISEVDRKGAGSWINVNQDREVKRVLGANPSRINTQYELACEQSFQSFAWIRELIKNAKEANASEIDFKIFKGNNGELYYEISDNGDGLSANKLPYLYIPGYTDKPPRGADKNFGWGFFTIFQKDSPAAQEVFITSCKKGNPRQNLWLRKAETSNNSKAEDRVIMEMAYGPGEADSKQEAKCRRPGTSIIIKSKQLAETISPLLLLSNLLRNKTEMVIKFNGKSIKDLQSKIQGKTNLVLNSICNAKTTNGNFLQSVQVFAGPSVDGLENGGSGGSGAPLDCYKYIPKSINILINGNETDLSKNKIAITYNLNGDLAQTTTRQSYLYEESMTPYIKKACLAAAFKILGDEIFLNKSRPIPQVIPYDFFYDFRKSINTGLAQTIANNKLLSDKLNAKLNDGNFDSKEIATLENSIFQVLVQTPLNDISSSKYPTIMSIRNKIEEYLKKNKILNEDGSYAVDASKKLKQGQLVDEYKSKIPVPILNIFENKILEQIEREKFQQNSANNSNKASIIELNDFEFDEKTVSSTLKALPLQYRDKDTITAMQVMKNLAEKFITIMLSKHRELTSVPKIKFYFKSDGSAAHARGSSSAITNTNNTTTSSTTNASIATTSANTPTPALVAFNLLSTEFLNFKEMVKSNKKDPKTIVSFIKTLTHEFTHVLEGTSEEVTHHQEFFRKQRELIKMFLVSEDNRDAILAY